MCGWKFPEVLAQEVLFKLHNQDVNRGGFARSANAGALAQVTRICSSRSLAARELSAKHGCALQTTTDYTALLADPDIHVVSICSYHHQHKEQAIAAVRAGKHIIY